MLRDRYGREIEEGDIVAWMVVQELKDGKVVEVKPPVVVNQNDRPMKKLTVVTEYEFYFPVKFEAIPDLIIVAKVDKSALAQPDAPAEKLVVSEE